MLKQANDPISRLYALADMIEHGWNGMGFDMEEWAEVTTCGTTGCIAGHAIAAWEPEYWAALLGPSIPAWMEKVRTHGEVLVVAARLLGLTKERAFRLFHNKSLTRKTAAARLREIAAEKEMEDMKCQ